MNKYQIIYSTQGYLSGKIFECDNLNPEKLSLSLGTEIVSSEITMLEEGVYKYQTVHYTLIIKEVK
jgi:hypothetical protein